MSRRGVRRAWRSLTLLGTWAAGAPAAPVTITSSHDAQLIFPGETLTLTIEAASPEQITAPVTIHLLDVNNERIERYALAPGGAGRVVDAVSGLAEGYYAYHVLLDGAGPPDAFTRIGVIPRPLEGVTPENSPVGTDAWLAWRFPHDPASQRRAALLMRRMGIRWARDRLRWGDVQPARGVWDWSGYDECFAVQAEAGLRVVPVFHDLPAWAAPDGVGEPATRPVELDDLAAFAEAAARRYRRTVAGFEIGNEFNSEIFWRGTAADFAAFTKAAATGLWRGAPELTRLLGSTTDTLDLPAGRADAAGVIAGHVLPFVDAVTPHAYGPIDIATENVRWWRTRAPAHAVWMTETGTTAIARVGPFVAPEERAQAAHLVQAFALALGAGAERVFHFCLTDFFEEGERPFGLVECHGEMWIPRPGLIALARLAAQLSGGAEIVSPRDGDPAGLRRVRLATPRGHLDVRWLDEGEAPRPDAGGETLDIYGEPLDASDPLGASPAVTSHPEPIERPAQRVEGQRPPFPPAFLDLTSPVASLEAGQSAALRLRVRLTAASEEVAGSVLRLREVVLPWRVSTAGFDEREALHFSSILLPEVSGGDFRFDPGLTAPAPWLGGLWGPSPASVRITDELRLAGHDEVADRAVLEIPLQPPLTVTRPALIDVTSPAPAAGIVVANTTSEARTVVLEWTSGGERLPILSASRLHLALAAQATAEVVFPAVRGDWHRRMREANPAGTLAWRSGSDQATGEALPEWNAIPRRPSPLDWWSTLWPWQCGVERTVAGAFAPQPPARLFAAWDDEALWLRAEMPDEDIEEPTPRTRPWAGDALEVYLDLRSPGDLGRPGRGEGTHQIIAAPRAETVWLDGALTDAVSAGGGTRREGEQRWWTLTLRVPWNALDLDGPPAGRVFGLDWGIDDLDRGSPMRAQMMWHGTVDNWRDAGGYARVVLER